MMKRVIFGMLLLGLSLSANAQRGYSGTWEWSISALYQDSKSMGSENGSSLKVDSDVGLGFNVGYYLTDHFSLGADFDFLRPKYKAVLVDDTVVPAETTEIRHEMSQFNGRFKANYDFLDGPFRPFVEAGLGWTYFDSNVTDGPPIVGCWWHPYWGYICDGYYRTFNDTIFSYGVGAGFKYRFVGDSFLKLSVNQWWLDGVGAAGDEDLTGARLEYGWRF
jgi:opacity protein-like surface antigen